MEQKKIIKVIDKAVFVFILIFLVSLTNSIFVNQIGYFGALILLLVKFVVQKKSPFQKTGLELAFGLFILAEIFSAIFSIDQPHAFQNLLKRVLLLPVVYTIVSGTTDFDRAKLYSKVYLAAAFLTILAYIIFAYDHFIDHLYSIEAKGPSPFQYVMTAGGLIGFAVIYFFTFLINEKSKSPVKFILFAAFGISLIALLASYTRAAWLGTASGIILIIFIKRKWSLAVPLILLLIFAVFYFKSESSLYIFDIGKKEPVPIEKIDLPGKAWWSSIQDSSILIASYEAGLVRVENKNARVVRVTESPLITIEKWKDDLYAGIQSDLRFIVLKNQNDKFEKVNEFISPGRTHTFVFANSCLYVFDIDSGLTVFTDPLNTDLKFRFPEFKNIFSADVNSEFLTAYSLHSNKLYLMNLKNNIPDALIDSIHINSVYSYESFIDSLLFFSNDKGLIIYDVSNGRLNLISGNDDLSRVNMLTKVDTSFIAVDGEGKFVRLKLSNNNIEIISESNLGLPPKFISIKDNRLYLSYHKTNRLFSIFDPNHNTNMERLTQWGIGLKILSDYPIFGVGDIDLKKIYSEYKEYYHKEDFGHLHNNYVHVLVILGIFGFAVFIFLLYKILMLNIKIYGSLKERSFASSFALGTIGVFTAFLISGLAEWNFGDQEIITMVWFTVGLNIAFYKTLNK